MPEQLRSLLYITILALVTFFFAKKITANIVSEPQFNRWRNTWLALTFIAFLSGNFWIFAILSALLLWYVGRLEQNPFALFLVLLFVAPRISNNIPGFGIVNFLFSIDYVAILSLAVLLPAFLSLRSKGESAPFLKYWTDRLLLTYMILDVTLLMRDTSVTDAMRAGVSNFTDVFLPYYVASRGIKNLQQFKEVIAAFITAAMVAAAAAMFEYSRFWLLYANLKNYLGVTWEMGGYLGRGDNLRALATLGQPIILGYVMVIAIGFYLFVSKTITSRWLRWLGWAFLLGGLYVPISRGPWVGAFILILFFIVISPKSTKNLSKIAIITVLIVPILAYIPSGQKVINMLPFIGKTDTENVEYRVRLIDNAFIVFNRYPIFGTVNFNDDLAALGMTQGEGIVDVVNSYLFELLEHGLVGLSLFVGFFIIVIFKMSMVITRNVDKTSEIHLLGRALLSCLIGTMVTITTVSSILVLPVIYWIVAGLSVAYMRLIEQVESSQIVADLQSYRLAFDALPAIPVTHLAFSALATHRVVLDTNPTPRIIMSMKARSTIQTAIIPDSTRKSTIKKHAKQPELASIYHQAKKIRASNQLPHIEKISPEQVATSTKAEMRLVTLGKVKVLNGSNTGRELILSKVLTKLGKPNIQVAVISRREEAYYITHLEGAVFPIVNDVYIGVRAHKLNHEDIIEISGIKMQFYSEAESP